MGEYTVVRHSDACTLTTQAKTLMVNLPHKHYTEVYSLTYHATMFILQIYAISKLNT